MLIAKQEYCAEKPLLSHCAPPLLQCRRYLRLFLLSVMLRRSYCAFKMPLPIKSCSTFLMLPIPVLLHLPPHLSSLIYIFPVHHGIFPYPVLMYKWSKNIECLAFNNNSAWVAQSVERVTLTNPPSSDRASKDHLKVAGSSPASGSIPESSIRKCSKYVFQVLMVVVEICGFRVLTFCGATM